MDKDKLVCIPASEFLYGKDRQRLYLPEFWISKWLITNAEYAEFVTITNHEPPGYWGGNAPASMMANHPVVNIFWHEAAAYAEWMGMRLPAEEEWEKAARGTRGREYPWGDQEPTAELCNFGMNVGQTTAVGHYSPQGDSPYDCTDMSGNVWEWTNSWFSERQQYRVLRGGAFRYRSPEIQAAFRFSLLPESSYNDVGFRVVKR